MTQSIDIFRESIGRKPKYNYDYILLNGIEESISIINSKGYSEGIIEDIKKVLQKHGANIIITGVVLNMFKKMFGMNSIQETISLVKNNFVKTGKLTEDEFNQLKKATQINHNKYIFWLSKQFIEDKSINLNHARDIIELFDDMVRRKKIEQGDINKYSNLNELEDITLEKHKDYKKTQEIKKTTKEEGSIVLENDKVVVRNIKSYDASCKYGKGTKWCITTRDNDAYWKQYASKFINFYFIFPKVDLGQDLDKIAIAVYPTEESGEVYEVYDAKDKLINEEFPEITRELNIPMSIFKTRDIKDIEPHTYCGVDKNQINIENGLVNVDGDVRIKIKSEKLLFKFGKITGYFDCGNNNLTTLQGAPREMSTTRNWWKFLV